MHIPVTEARKKVFVEPKHLDEASNRIPPTSYLIRKGYQQYQWCLITTKDRKHLQSTSEDLVNDGKTGGSAPWLVFSVSWHSSE